MVVSILSRPRDRLVLLDVRATPDGWYALLVEPDRTLSVRPLRLIKIEKLNGDIPDVFRWPEDE
jgi:hypothetical protein